MNAQHAHVKAPTAFLWLMLARPHSRRSKTCRTSCSFSWTLEPRTDTRLEFARLRAHCHSASTHLRIALEERLRLSESLTQALLDLEYKDWMPVSLAKLFSSAGLSPDRTGIRANGRAAEGRSAGPHCRDILCVVYSKPLSHCSRGHCSGTETLSMFWPRRRVRVAFE